MAQEKSYTPVASYDQLKEAETAINNATTVDDIREATRQHGSKVGYKAFCYLLTGKMTPEGMKPEEAAASAAALEAKGQDEAAQEIYMTAWNQACSTHTVNDGANLREEKEDNQQQTAVNGTQVRMHQGEIEIDIALVRQLLTEQFPHLVEKTITLVQSTGTVNAIYRLGDDLYVRLPRLAKWADSVNREWQWLPRIAPHVSLTIPQPVARGKPTIFYPYPWAIYRWIEGASYQDDLISNERQAAHDLANFILELRRVNMQGAPHGGRAPLPELDTVTRSAIKASHEVIDTVAALEVWTRALQVPAWNGKPVWIHGDLLKSNLLVHAGQLCAVIDFGGVGIGDPAADIVAAWAVFNQEGRDVFRQALGVDDDTWYRARGYALHQSVLIIPYYPETNPHFVTMAKRIVNELIATR